ncbi:hypothetical protein BT93_K0297 [Corymbia citriodora subsp. variegata]|nr:hypothetical protein BT93_K0297 [Corymbia citriodora subsp. variegata]
MIQTISCSAAHCEIPVDQHDPSSHVRSGQSTATRPRSRVNSEQPSIHPSISRPQEFRRPGSEANPNRDAQITAIPSVAFSASLCIWLGKMPGPGPHLMYAMGSGLALTSLSGGRFGPHHTLAYTLNAFFGPDIGSFSEWLGSTLSDLLGFAFARSLGSLLADAIHHPFYYVLILGLPLSLLFSWVSRVLLRKGVLDSVSGVPLTRRQCLLLVAAGSLSHFFLDHLFEENGHSSMYTWILSTGWWKNRAPVNPDAVVVVGFLCICLICGFIYINRVKSLNSIRKRSYQSLKLIGIIGSLYCVWCASQIYWVNPRRAAVGEEADLGILVFMATYFFLPHGLCILSMNPKTELPL